jgi:hypothetical protein
MVFTVRYELHSYISCRSSFLEVLRVQASRCVTTGCRLEPVYAVLTFSRHVTGKQAMAWALSGLQTFWAGRGHRITGFVWKFRPQNVPESPFLFAYLKTSRQNRRRRGTFQGTQPVLPPRGRAREPAARFAYKFTFVLFQTILIALE